MKTPARAALSLACLAALGPAAGLVSGPSATAQEPADPAAHAFLHQEGHVHLAAPLYPSPRQDVPIQVGGTFITNPAFAPHEYLYPHDYNAMYGPFYYRSRGTWAITPWGVRTNERWDLVGTTVKVKYRSKIPFWTGFHPPYNVRHTLFDNEWGNTPGIGSPATENLHFHH